MRSRNIKPGFYKNENLAECNPLSRILFTGLWALSDREGRLSDRPKRIKIELLPYDDCNCEEMLDELESKGFISRYGINGDKYIQVVNFLKHQNPHVKEKPSEIPPLQQKAQESTVQAQESTVQAQESTVQARLIPDSCNLIPDSKRMAPEAPTSQLTNKQFFERLKAIANKIRADCYSKKGGGSNFPWNWIHNRSIKKHNPECILYVLEQSAPYLGELKGNVFAYLNSVLKTSGANWYAHPKEKENEKDKREWVDFVDQLK